MTTMVFLQLLLAFWPLMAPAAPPHISYTLHVDSADFTTFSVRMHVSGAPARFTIAAAAHSEYDDKYWRYLEDLRVANGSAQRLDSVRWQITAPAGDATVTYRIRPPVVHGMRSAWPAFLTSNGGLLGGPHSFLYVVGLETATADVTLEIPSDWRTASALDTTSDPHRYTARDIAQLEDSPIIVGPHLNVGRFRIDDVPHDVAYWGIPGDAAFDTLAFRGSIEKLAREYVRFWGNMPYARYLFIYEDSAYGGGLEHVNSVTLGSSSAELAKDPRANIGETAHEFFHTWNLMHIRPAEYRGVDYRVQPPIDELWFSEGVTMFYADLLRRRAGLPVDDSLRQQHLSNLIAAYSLNTGYSQHSAEEISRITYNSPRGALGDFAGIAHLPGELIGTVLDIVIRDATNGARSMDDVMRRLYADPANGHFRDSDLERIITSVCGCDVRPIFDRYVRGAAPIDFAYYLALIGLRVEMTRAPAPPERGIDPRIRALLPAPGDTLRLFFWDPSSSWVRAGLHTNDRVLSLNERPVHSWPEMASMLRALHAGDSVRFAIVRNGVPQTITAAATGFELLNVKLEPLPKATSKQQRLLAAWQHAQ